MLNRISLRNLLESTGAVLIVCLAFILPFEARRPVLPLGFVQITTVEFILYLFLAVWGLVWLSGNRFNCTPCHGAVAAWAAVILLSALFAPDERAAAFKFALRSLGGCVLFFAAAHHSRSLQSIRRTAIALVAGASLSAVAGGAEIIWPSAARLLAGFKTQPSLVGGFLRASGTFQYANIAAMYWEAVAPLSLALALSHGQRGRSSRAMWLYVGAVFLLAEAVTLSMSRAAIVLTVFMLISCLAVARSTANLERVVLAACVVAAVSPLSFHLLLGDSFRLRMLSPQQSDWYRVEYSGTFDLSDLRTRQALLLPVKVRNLGEMTWNSQGEHPIALSYHWEDPDSGSFAIWDGVRTPLPVDVPPNSELSLNARIRAPGKIGRYFLHLDMVQEGATWFSLQGSPGIRIPVDVRAAVSQGPEEEFIPDMFKPTLLRIATRSELWRAALNMWKDHPFLGAGPDNFRLLHGHYLNLKTFDNRNHSNSLYMETLATLGVAGIIALAVLFVSFTRVFWSRLSRPGPGGTDLMLLGLGASFASFILHGFVDYFLEFSPTYALFWLVLGMAAGYAGSKTTS
jgi:hypothetical protein